MLLSTIEQLQRENVTFGWENINATTPDLDFGTLGAVKLHWTWKLTQPVSCCYRTSYI